MRLTGETPGRRLAPLRGLGEPGAGHVLLGDALGLSIGLGPEIDHVLAVDLVGAEHAGQDFLGETLRRLHDGGHRIERDIERGRSLGIEPAAVNSGAVA